MYLVIRPLTLALTDYALPYQPIHHWKTYKSYPIPLNEALRRDC